MSTTRVLLLACCLTLIACSTSQSNRSSGIDTSNLDRGVRPQDRLYQYAVGGWLQRNEIPNYLSHWSTSSELQVRVYTQLRTHLEKFAADKSLTDPDKRKLADMYASYMDERGIEEAGLTPLNEELKQIRAASKLDDIIPILARFMRIGISVPIAVSVHPDSKDATRNLADFEQSGLSLPDRDYYLSDQPRLLEMRAKYLEHIEKILALAGVTSPDAIAADILAFETKLAGAQWTQVANRDPVATYNLLEPSAVQKLAPGVDWIELLSDLELATRVTTVNVSEPTYFTTFARVAQETPIETWQGYLIWRLIDQASPFLPQAFRDQSSEFYGRVLSGVTVQRPRWLRGIGFIDDSMGDALGRVYVEEHFPPEAQESARLLINNLVETFRRRISELDWMGEQSKKEAQAKLAALRIKFGYPQRWRDFSDFRTSRGNLVGNWLAYRGFEYRRSLQELARPVDRDAWRMTPQTVNGYYSAWRNEVVLPAALMQPPYFQADADAAANYGGFGWFVAHELSHAFDNRGSKFDGNGNLRDWMAPEDHERFKAKTRALIDQYSSYEAVPGFMVNGELTLGENIADVSGLAIAYEAYQMSLQGKPAPVIDGLTADQRFFLSFATIWAGKVKEADAIARSKSDTHAPSQFRVEGSARNQDSFHRAFDVEAEDGMYLPPSQRVRIW